MLKVANLNVELEDGSRKILKDVSLEINPGEVTLVMGPNGAGKSTLGKAILEHYSVKVDGSVLLDGEELLGLEVNEKLQKGFFLGYQAPVEVPGVRLGEFLRIAYNNLQTDEKEQLDPWSFMDVFGILAETLGLDASFAERSLNDGFSGGEKKKCEVLQMLVLNPKYAILDEVDSGLDLDAMKIIFTVINKFVEDSGSGVILISHNAKILDFITPGKVYLIKDGQIAQEGGRELAEQIITEGYAVTSS